MWTLDNLPKAHLKATYSFEPTKKWIDSAQRSAVRLAGGCSASFISPNGLVLTNHHCARECIDQLSSSAKNYVRDGFIAKTIEDELKCPVQEVNRLEKVTDVTDIIKAATEGTSGEVFSKNQKAAKSKLESECVGKNAASIRCDLVELYHGGRYALYQYRRFQDVRLVWAPEEQIAFFGGDPDNFNFPRFDLDASVFRVYENGKPLKVLDYFPFSKNGAKENELVMTLGHPGSTQRSFTVAQLERLRDVDLIPRLLYSSELRGVINQFASQGEEQARISRDDLFGIENGLKARKGMLQALLDPAVMDAKRKSEADLRAFVEADATRLAKYGKAWSEIAAAQQVHKAMITQKNFFEGSWAFSSSYFFYARVLVRAAAERNKPNGERLREYTESALPNLAQRVTGDSPVYPELETVTFTFSLEKMREWIGVDNSIVRELLGQESPETMAKRMIHATTLGDVKVRKALWDGGQNAIDASTDPFILLAKKVDAYSRELRLKYESDVEAVENKNAELVAAATFEKYGTSVYPDATFSLRLSDGVVKGWEYLGEKVDPFTSIDGAFKRHTGAYPFDLPQSWLDAKSLLNVKQSLNFVSTNDIIGGNSGSPIINRNAEIVGLVFDGNIHSLGGAYWFDESLNRTVSVHSGAILEALKKVYKADRLVKEIESARKR
jgi:V8-like Glu-specific endopeptidase